VVCALKRVMIDVKLNVVKMYLMVCVLIVVSALQHQILSYAKSVVTYLINEADDIVVVLDLKLFRITVVVNQGVNVVVKTCWIF